MQSLKDFANIVSESRKKKANANDFAQTDGQTLE